MEIISRPLNKGEIFPCAMRKAKEVFKDTSVVLNFAYTSRSYGTFMRTPDYYYLKNNIKGTVIASMYMYPRDESPLLSLFVLKETLFSNELRDEFENKFLSEFYNFYKSLLNDDGMVITHMMLVELLDGTLKLHCTKF